MRGAILTAMLIILAMIIPCPVSGQIPAASAKYKATVIRETRAVWGLNGPVALTASQLQAESGFNPNARSGVGAAGIAQFLPASYAWLHTVYPKDLPSTTGYLDPGMAIRGLVFYDHWIFARLPMYQVVDENRLAAALAGYNGGLGWTLKDARLGPCTLWWGCAEKVNDGRTAANLTENRNYPFKIIRVFEPRYRAAGWN